MVGGILLLGAAGLPLRAAPDRELVRIGNAPAPGTRLFPNPALISSWWRDRHQPTPAKLGELVQASPQSRARSSTWPGTLYLGMGLQQFQQYADAANWVSFATARRGSDSQVVRRYMQPGGEGLYTPPPEQQLVYARGFLCYVYFIRDRLVGLRLVPDPQEQGFVLPQLMALVSAWFPDDTLTVYYQLQPSSQELFVQEALIGQLPVSFQADLGRGRSLPFCRVEIQPGVTLSNPPTRCNLALSVRPPEGQ